MDGSTASAEGTKPTKVRWRIIALLMAYVAVSHFNRIGMSVAGTEAIMPGYQVKEATMGWVYTSYLIVYTLCMVPGGWLIDRFGACAAWMAVGFGSAVLVALTGISGFVFESGSMLVAALLLIRSMLGAFTAPLHPGAARMIALWMPIASRATANGLIHGSALVGITATYYVFGAMIERFGWMNAFVVAAIAPLSLALLWTSYAANSPAEHRAVNREEREIIEKGSATVASLGESPSVWPARTILSLALLTFSYATVSYVQYLFFFWIEYYYKTVMQLGNETARFNSTVLTLAMGAGIMAGGWVCDRAIGRFGRRVGTALLPILGTATCALGLAGGIFIGGATASLVSFIVAMAAIGTVEGPFWTSATGVGGRQSGKACAIMNTGGNAGGLLAPVITPWFSSYFGWQAGIGLAAGICFLGALPWFWIGGAANSGANSTEHS